MRHQIPRLNADTSQNNNGSSSSSSSAAPLPAGNSGGSVDPSLPPTATPVRGTPPGNTPHSVIRTIRQMTMMANPSEPRRTSFVSPNSASVNALLANLEAVHQAEMKSLESPAVIVRHVVTTIGNIIKEMRFDAEQGKGSAGSVVEVANCTDVAALRQRLVTVERANHMMSIHLDLMDLQKKLEVAEQEKVDEKKTFVIATREELYKEIVELLEAEFSCSICNEIFILPSVTKCGHTFCELCIATWTRDKVDCPICRTMIFTDWGKHVEMDNFITRLHLRLSDEIRESRERLVQERVVAIEQLRNTPRRNEGAAFVDALRFIRDQQGRTTPTTARALAERFRAMRRSAADANIDESGQAARSSASSGDGPTARMRARLMEELESLRHHQQQNVDSLNSLSRPGASGSHSPSSSSSVARIRVRPSPGVSFTLVAPRSMLSQQSPSTAPPTPSVPTVSTANAAIRAPVDSRESPASPPQPTVASCDSPSREGLSRDCRTPSESNASVRPTVEDQRRVPHGLLMARYSLRHLQYLQSQHAQQVARCGLDRAVAQPRPSSAPRVTESPSQISSATNSATPSLDGSNNSARNEVINIEDDDNESHPSAANAVRTIRSIFSSLDSPSTSSPPATVAVTTDPFSSFVEPHDSTTTRDTTATNSSSASTSSPTTTFPYSMSSFRLASAGNQGNSNFPFPHETSRSMSSRLTGLVGSETSTTLSSSGRPISSTIHTTDLDGGDTTSIVTTSPIRSASSDILRAFSDHSTMPAASNNTVTTISAAGGSNSTLGTSPAEDDPTDLPVPARSPTDADLDSLQRRLRLGQLSLHDIISFRQRFENVIDGSSILPHHPEDDILPDVDMDINEPLSVIFPPPGQRGVTDDQQVIDNNGMSTIEDGSSSLDGGSHSSSPIALALRPRSRRGIRSEERPRLLHHLRESRRRRRERNHRDEHSSRSRERRGRETTITISFCNRGDEDRSNNNNNSNAGTSDTSNNLNSTGSRSQLSPTPAQPLAARPSTSSISNLDASSIPIPLVMDCDSDTTSPGPSSSTRGMIDRNENIDSGLANVGQANASDRPGLNTEDIEILFSDIEDA